MAVSATLIRTDNFAVEWGDDDSEPPPGLDFSRALLDELKRRGVESKLGTIEKDHWEHTNWYFWVTWENVEYSFRIECSMQECAPALWLIDITRPIGIWKSIFGRGRERHEIAASFLEVAGECLETIAKVGPVEWIDSDVAIDQIYNW